VTTGTGNGTVAVVAVAAVTHLNGASHGHGGKGQDGEDLHLDWWFLSFWNGKEKFGCVGSEDGEVDDEY
jgi:hypothetical protein